MTQHERKAAAADRAPHLRLATDEPARRSYRKIALVAIAVAVVGAATVHLLRASRESTDNAQVEADVVAVAPRIAGVVTRVLFVENQQVKAGDPLVELDSRAAHARLLEAEAELKSAEAQKAGAQAEVAVVEATARGARSVARAVLAGTSVNGRSKADEVDQVEAQLAAAEVEDQSARTELGRARQLFDQKLIEPQKYEQAEAAAKRAAAKVAEYRAHLRAARSSPELARALTDEAKARYDQTSAGDAQVAQARARLGSAEARVTAASAALELARLDLAYSTLTAPQDGVAAKKAVTVGQMLAVGQPIAQIVPREVWVTANFKETQLQHMRPGQAAEIRVDSYPGQIFRGEVESLSGATGARFTLLPPDNATGNFVKVVQRVPVRIRLLLPSAKEGDASPVLRPGMSATVTIKTQ